MEATPDPRLDADVAAMLARQAAADVRRWIACVGLVAKPRSASLADEVEAELAAWPEQVPGG